MHNRRPVDTRAERDGLLAVLGISALCLLLVVIEPLGVDNAVLHSIGKDWALYGRIPYLGSWDNNFPGIMILHALEIFLFGTSAIAFRLFDVAIQLLFVAFLYWFLLRWLRPHTAGLAAVLYTLYYVAGGTYLYGQQDGYGMMAVLVGASLIIDREAIPFPQLLLSAVIVGLSFLMRPTFLLYPGLLAIYLALDPTARIVARKIPVGVIYFLLSLLPMAGLLAFYATRSGGLDAFYTSTIRFNLDLYTKLSGGSFWIEVGRTGLLIPLAVTGYITFRRNREAFTVTRRDALLELSLIAGGLFTVVLMGKFWRYQFAPFFMCVIPVSAIGIEHVRTKFRSPIARHWVTVGFCFFSSFFYYNPISPLAFVMASLDHNDPIQAVEDLRRNNPGFGSPVQRELLAYLNQPDLRRKSIEVCGFDPYIRLSLERPCIGPYTTFHAIAFRKTPSISASDFTDYQRRWQAAYVSELTKRRPEILVLGRLQPFWYIRDVYVDCLARISGFDQSVARNYRLLRRIGAYEVYQRTR